MGRKAGARSTSTYDGTPSAQFFSGAYWWVSYAMPATEPTGTWMVEAQVAGTSSSAPFTLTAGGQGILDVRSASRFAGAVPEPRPGLRAGHMPGARNLPLDRFLERNAKIQWGIVVCVYGLSHAPALLLLEFPNYQDRGAFLLFFLVVVTVASQMVQELASRWLRRRPVARMISRSFSWRAWFIGAFVAVAEFVCARGRRSAAGIILCVGGLGTLGYLAVGSQLMYEGLGPTTANILVGFVSAVIDNIPVMYAVLTMNPQMADGHWLLVTLTAGVGGSLLSIGSAAGVAVMGQAHGVYTFFSHLRWTWAIALGYAASIWVHLLVNG